MSNSPKIFTLKQVVSSVRKTIEDRYANLYWVKAEMHKLNQFPSGHCFPELLQKENGKIVAQISGSIWKHNFERINKRFIEVVKEPIKDDTTLLLQVKVNFHELYGLSLQIMDIDPNYALGELQKEREDTLRRLQKEGLINKNQGLDFPVLPKRIAVISAESSKGLSDFMQVISKNPWNYRFFTMLFPASLQGDNAERSISDQLKRIHRVKHHFDCVVIVRGGGGEVGLSCYNNYSLCKNIASFSLPILTGIGHSTNLTVAEMISYRNAITPTELGDFLIQAFHNFSVPVKNTIKRIKASSLVITSEAQLRLKSESKLFKNVVKQTVMQNKQIVNSSLKELASSVKFSVLHQQNSIRKNEQGVYRNARFLVSNQTSELGKLNVSLPVVVKAKFLSETNKVINIAQSIRLMDPINVLNRGFSITLLNGKTIGKNNKVKNGDLILTKTATFNVKSKVEITENNE